MWISDSWKEYRIIDASDGEKLEIWGGYSLVRPDPQVIWHSKNPILFGAVLMRRTEEASPAEAHGMKTSFPNLGV